MVVSGTNTYTGTTTVSQGTLQINANAPSGAAGALGNTTSAIVLNNANTGANDTAVLIGSSGVTVNRAFTVANSGTGTPTLGGNIASGTGTFSGAITLNKAAELTAAGNSNITFSGAIGGTGGVTKVGSGTVTLSASNGFSGGATVSNGTLSITQVASLGSGALTLDGGTLQYAGPSATTTSKVPVLTSNGGTIDASGTSAAATIGFTSGATITFSGGGSRTLTLTGSNTGQNAFNSVIADYNTGTGEITNVVPVFSSAGSW